MKALCIQNNMMNVMCMQACCMCRFSRASIINKFSGYKDLSE